MARSRFEPRGAGLERNPFRAPCQTGLDAARGKVSRAISAGNACVVSTFETTGVSDVHTPSEHVLPKVKFPPILATATRKYAGRRRAVDKGEHR